jgi:subfamily B ATP-binding cassette protein HlyB/CyaB
MVANDGQQVSGSDGVDSGLSALVAMLGYLQRPADYGQLRHALGHGEKASLEDLTRLAKRDGVRARLAGLDLAKLQSAPLPAIAETVDGFLIVGKASEERILVQNGVDGQVSECPADRYQEIATGRYLLLTTRESVAGLARKFDVSWFIPALVRYRKLLGEVLLASLFIQILGLISPIFFQVVIDKVLVHKSLTTLEVLAIGMAGLFFFETVLSGLRQYLFAHTTSRVDVELGANLFRHLQNLPMGYFTSRRVGDTVARVRELETIRTFLTSNAVTLVLDLLFTVVLLGVIYHY